VMIRLSLSPASCPALCRASTFFLFSGQGVDGRDKPGHDEQERKVTS